MADNRKDQIQGPSIPCPPLLPAETLRSAASPPPAKEEGKEEKGIPMVWRIFGGTILSIGALIAVTLYQQLFSKVEALGDMAVKKDEFYNLRRGIWDQIEKLRGSEQGVDAELQQRCARLEQKAKCCAEAYQEMAPEVKTMRELLLSYQKERSERLEQQVRASDEERKQLLGEIQRLRDRLATVEMRKTADVKKASFRRDN